MSLVDLYNASSKPRVVQARQIPNQKVTYFDTQKKFQAGEFKTDFKSGDPTTFTAGALDYYGTELNNMVIPQSFVKIDSTIPLNEWNPANSYYTPGKP